MNEPTTPIVLVVDDDPDTRNAVVRMLVPLGVNILESNNGRQALSILKKQHVDVVISDLMMPRMSGIMLLHSMLEAGHHMPFVLMTGFSDKDSAIQALRLGAFDYMEKPLHESDLQPVIVEALKVSREQQMLLGQLKSEGSPRGGTPADRSAELQIMKMRTFRYKGESFDYAVSRDNVRTWHDLKELFVQEAEPQLLFSEGALKALATAEHRAKELAFILRVIQSVRMASEAIRLNDISEVAWSLETHVAALKQVPDRLADEHLELMIRVNAVLRSKVAALADPVARAAVDELERATAAVRDPKSA